MSDHPAVAFLVAAHQQAELDARFTDGYTNGAFSFDVADRDAADHCLGAGSPVSVLRRVAAEREMLAEHADDGCGDCTACARPSEETSGRGDAFFEPLPWPCRTVLLIAKGWDWEAQR